MTAGAKMRGAAVAAASVLLFTVLTACTTGVSVGVGGYRSMGWYGDHGLSPYYGCCGPSFHQREFSAAVLPPVHYGDFGDDFGY